MVSEGNTSKNVCVIGAGPAGLVAARELRKEGHNVVVIEQNHDIGGQWLYDPKVEKQNPLAKDGVLTVHSSIYESLRLASPREIMGFSDFPFVVKKGRDMRRFPGHKELLLYLQDFCEKFGLREMIRFNTRVEYVGMLNHPVLPKDLKWVVKSKAVEEVYDAVVIATGHYSQPRLPQIRGMDAWRRKQMHSHIYRVPEPFRNEDNIISSQVGPLPHTIPVKESFTFRNDIHAKSDTNSPVYSLMVVVVIGNSLSGQDISMELVNTAKEIHLSAKSLTISQGLSKVISNYNNLHIHPEIESLHEDGWVLFSDGSCVVADTIIYCTGYSYSFPFLDTKGILEVDDDRVGPLYEHTFPPSLAPSLSFIGIPRKLIGFPFFESQAIWISQLLSGKRRLPSWDDMMDSIKEFYQSSEIAGIPKHKTHDLANFEYCDKYADYVGFPHLEEWRKELCLSSLKSSEINLETFRDSYEEHQELLQVAYNSPHFTQLGPEDFTS